MMSSVINEIMNLWLHILHPFKGCC